MKRKTGLDPERIHALIHQPHNALFRALISDPARADALIREHFPAPLRHLLEDTRARPGYVGQVDPHLRQAFADGVFEFGRCPDMPKLVVPTEHKRAPRPEVVDQLTDYTLGNRRRWKEVGAEPEIVPMLVTPDPAPTRAAWVGGVSKRGLRRLHMRPLRVECLWLAIAEHRYEALNSMASVRAVLGAMGCAYVEPAPLRTIRKVFRDLAGMPPSSLLWGMTYLYGLYTFAVEEDDYHALIRESDTGEREAEMATMFQQQMAERDELSRAVGRELGREEGRERERVDLLLRLVERRFGPVPAEAEARIRTASASELEAWVDAIFDARSLDDLLKK